MSKRRGLLVVLSGASGVGKTAIAARLLRLPDVARTVTATTRAARPGERDGVDYHFLTDAAFRARVARGEFLEHAQVHGHLYGTPRDAVQALVGRGLVCLLVIDVQGAATLRRNGVEGRFVFVAPPSEDELERRLRGRGTDSDEVAHLVDECRSGDERKFTPEEITDRLFLPMLLEATRVLEDGLVRDARDVDLALIFGIGFPPFKGGLFFWADQVGAAKIVEKLKPYAKLGKRFESTKLLTKVAAANTKFYD